MSRLKKSKKPNPKRLVLLLSLLVVTIFLLWNIETLIERVFTN